MERVRNTEPRMIHFDFISENEVRYLKEKWRMNRSQIVRNAISIAVSMEKKGISVEHSRNKKEYSENNYKSEEK